MRLPSDEFVATGWLTRLLTGLGCTACGDQKRFDPSKSATYVNLTGPFGGGSIEYGTGTGVEPVQDVRAVRKFRREDTEEGDIG